MANPFIGQIQAFAFNFAPQGWAFCNGPVLPIQQNVALFSLLGTAFGGNGQTTFALPDLRGRVPMHFGVGPTGYYEIGEQGGLESVTLTSQQIPAHSHAFMGSSATATELNPTVNAALATVKGPEGKSPFFYGPISTAQPLNVATVSSNAGADQPHANIQPYLTLSWCIAIAGVFPPRN